MDAYLSMVDVTKVYHSFGRDVHALKKAQLTVQKGTVHGLLGENGAGKSTLMKILAGVEHKNSGTILYQGKEINFKNAIQAAQMGIGMVHQHFSLLDDYTILQNVMLGMEPTKALGIIDVTAARKGVEEAAKKCGFDMDLDQKVGKLSMGQRQKVEILRILYSNVDLLIFDEPTSVLVEQEIQSLLETIRTLKAQGKTIIYISHKVEEVLAITDEVTVLRNGITVQTCETREIAPAAMVRMMVGKNLDMDVERKPQPPQEPLLSVRDLWAKSGLVYSVKGVDFDVHAGEIVAIAGINGNGQQELVECLFGLRQPLQGMVQLSGQDISSLSSRKRRLAGMGYIPEDRIHVGSCGNATIGENIMIDRYFKPDYLTHGWIKWKSITKKSRELISAYNIKAPDENSYVGALSGGHIQRTILARELSSDPKVLLACEVTMGLDVESTRYIHDEMLALREKGRAILLISSNMNEIMNLADRILVMHMGELTACLKNQGAISKEEIGEYMLGLKYQEGYGPKTQPGKKEAAHA